MGEPHILYRIEGNIAILTINRPEAKNGSNYRDYGMLFISSTSGS